MEGLGTGVDAGGCLPAKVEAEPVTCLAIRQAFVGLQEHHRRHHAGRDGRASSGRVGIQIGEVVVSEHLVPVICEEAVDRAQLQPVTEEIPRVLEALLDRRTTECHGQILAYLRTFREFSR